ncbi:protein kinase [Streptacidiphilus sp. EB129]|uniref:protein kinase domain-containing protein n=1 Tax=Streptacidiphilus sp. EB129 TaxID=3156262 RepID=UPI003511913F
MQHGRAGGVPGTRWAAGQCFGPNHDPEQYRLLEFRHRGGEAEVWRAERTSHSGRKEIVAAKIMLERDPSEVRRWLGRWEDVTHNANRLGVQDLVVPTFLHGPVPHPPGGAPKGLVAYQISPWLDAVPLDQWARAARGGPAAAVDVLLRLCRIVDDLHGKHWVHRDISAANVLVDAEGRVKLIDLTFLAPLDSALTVAVYTPGHVPPESEQVGGLPTAAKDRFAVGTLARALLLPEHGRLDLHEPEAQTRRELQEAGLPSPVADWLCEALDAVPERRPAPLVPWAERGAELLRSLPAANRISCLGLLADGWGRPVVVVGGPDGVEFHAASPDETGTRLRTGTAVPSAAPAVWPGRSALPPSGGPTGVRDLAAARAADGGTAVFAVDRRAVLWCGTSGQGWSQALHSAAGIAAATTALGDVAAWTARGGVVHMLRWTPGVALSVSELRHCPADRVHAVAPEQDGGWGLLVERHGRLVHCSVTDPARYERTSYDVAEPAGAVPSRELLAEPVLSAALAPAPGGGLQAGAVLADGAVALWSRGTGGSWRRAPLVGDAADRAAGFALVGHRGGPTCAVVGGGGVRLRLLPGGTAGWWRPTLRPATRVALLQGADWRLSLAAVVEDEVHCWQEDEAQRWHPVPLAPGH